MSDYLAPIAATILPNIGGFLGGFITKNEVRPKPGQTTWYQSLKKPSFQPPSWVFGPVWTSLYCSMGYASYLVWRDGDGFNGEAALPLACYGTQLALNWAWSPIYFKYHKLGLACLENTALVGAVIATMITFNKVNETASYILIPYVCWATIEIGALWGAVVATMVTFNKVNPTASYMLIPYLGWVSFASFLCFSIWRLNKDRKD